jgi:hypothetical protein
MKDPIKIIHKFKNNNRRIQYKIFIFIGPSISEDIMKILDIIQNKDFFNSLISLSIKQNKILEEFYGEKWFEKFFTSYHLKLQIKQIENTPAKKKQIEIKFGNEWYKNNINLGNFKKITYSFAANYFDNLLDKKKNIINKNPELDYRTYNIDKSTIDLSNYKLIGGVYELQNYSNNELSGGKYDDDDDDEFIDVTDELIDVTEDSIQNNKKNNEDDIEDEEEDKIELEDFEEIVDEAFDLDELAKLYSNENIENDKVIKETSKMISEAINDRKWGKDLEELGIDYDKSQDNITYDINLEDVYKKYYITDEYIFKDDTIKTIKNKICITLPLSENFGKGIKLIPEAQYFWSEYLTPKGKEDIMIGQKWIKKNELLKIDIKPNENLKTYENLRNNLSYLKDSFGHKIKREDDETNILRFYEDYMTINEIYLLDIFNDLGLNYNPNPESKRNLFEVYINIYFPMITYDRLESIINLLNNKNNNEIKLIESEFLLIKNDCKLEKEIYITVENAKNNLENFNQYFAENYIIQSNIHVNINNPKNLTGTTSDTKYNLYRIFDNFILSEEYPFIQYQTQDGQVTYKFYTKSNNLDNNEVLIKWFENTPYGISFKILTRLNKYIAINLHESGRIEYKITWKEEDMATINNIIESYDYIRNLLKKINNENKKIKFTMPENDRFKYAFINTIQKFTIPEQFKINHNDLSEFCRFFFPYISLVIEPKKRVSKKSDQKESTISKYGTYLRYKRINKYDNRTKMHLRILYFLRNYELNDRELIDEIAKQFNITLEQTVKEIDFVRERYGKAIQKSSKLLKKLKALPKAKPPGIGIDIQGRDREKYKIRITGARTKEQLEEIVNFMKVLIYLYCQTYLYKIKEYQKLKETLKTLCKIAKRRNKVIEIVDYEVTSSNIKTITSLDKKRLAFKPEKGQSQWTRSCQNSGNDKKRRPAIIQGDTLDKLVKNSYKLNPKTNYYEKQVEITIKKKKYNVTLRAIKLTGDDNTYNFYTCDPSENNEFMHIGFLSRGNNPSDLCMPCCFKKDQLFSANKQKKNYYLRCIGEQNTTKSIDNIQSNIGDKLYILQETNKVQDNRFIYLPKYLDILFNKVWNHDHKIKNHYLYESKSGYFFKYTVKNDKYNFLGAISNIYEKNIDEIIELAIAFLEKDKKDIYFTFLNNGDIKETFKTKENFINYLKTSNYLEYDIIGELLALPNILSKNGLYYFILEKNILIIKKALEKDNIIERYYINCLNYENTWMMNEDRDIIILIKDTKYYFPIYRVQKDEKKDKKINLDKIFNINNKETINTINELKNYYNQSCKNTLYTKIIGNYYLFAKNIILLLIDKNINVTKQIIDDRNKCKYLFLDNNILLPVYPSGISYNFPFENINKFNISLDKIESVLKKINKINDQIKMDYIPKVVFYDTKEKDNIHIISILLENELIIPIHAEWKNQKSIKNIGIATRFQPLEAEIDKAIINKENIKTIDLRLIKVKEHIFNNESYNIFRLEFSLFLQNNKDIKEKIIIITTNNNININDKKNELRKILYKIINPKLAKELVGGSSQNNFVNVVNSIKNIENYNISNLREYCEISKTKDKCESNLHCSWNNESCKIRLDENMVINFINKILEELIQRDIQYKELIQDGDYYVSDIVDYSQYTNRLDQKIIKTSNFNIGKIMSELFGKEKIPIIGKRQNVKKNNEDIIEDYPELIELGKQLIQPIITNKDSIIRAFVNSYYWINNTLYDIESRNLGYFSELQTILTNQIKAKIIDFIFKNKIEQNDKFNKYLLKYFNNDEKKFIDKINKFRKKSYNTDGKLELYVLSYIFDNRIVVYNNYNNVIGLYLQGNIPITDENIKNFTNEQYRNKTIFIKLDTDELNTIPKSIYSLYYL